MVGNSDNKKHLFTGNGNTADIISAIMYADKRAAPYLTKLAPVLKRRNIHDTCKAIFDYVKEHITYEEDPDGYQFIQSPGHLFWGEDGNGNGKGDCKSMSVFCAGLLQLLGLRYSYRFVSQSRDKDYHHVFLVVPDERGQLIVLDCVDPYFNKRDNSFVKVKDIPAAPAPAPKRASIGSKIGEAAPAATQTELKRSGSFLAIFNPTWIEAQQKIIADRVVQSKIKYNEKLLPAIFVARKDPLGNDAAIYCFGMKFDSWDAYIKGYEEAIFPFYYAYASKVFNQVKEDWDSMKWLNFVAPEIMTWLGEMGKEKGTGFHAKAFAECAFNQLLYKYWDNNIAAFPADKLQKKQQAEMLYDGLNDKYSKVNKRYTSGFVDKAKDPFYDSTNLRVFADVHCYLTYGYPLDVMLQKAYNLQNIGTDSIPPKGVPYYNKRAHQWEQNGATQFQMDTLRAWCLPHDTRGGWAFNLDGTKRWIPDLWPTNEKDFVAYGTPYWTKGGFVMSNGVTGAALIEWTKNNPAPLGLVEYEKRFVKPGPQQAAQVKSYVDFYTKLVLAPMFPVVSASATNKIRLGADNVINPATGTTGVVAPITNFADLTPYTRSTTNVNDLSTMPTGPRGGGATQLSIRGKYAKIGEPITVIVGAVVAVITAIITLVIAILESKKNKEAIRTDMSNFPLDFPQPYQDVSGCMMQPRWDGVNVAWDKVCPDGTVTANVNPNAPENIPAFVADNPFTDPRNRNKLLVLLGLGAVGIYMLFFSKKSKK